MFRCVVFFLILIVKVLTTCPKDLVEWDSQCYSFHSNSSPFFDAELICKGAGGHLASVHDGFTNAFLAQKATKYFHESTESDFWIGATNLMASKTWNWTDGTKFDFNEWQKGEPQNITDSNCSASSVTNGYWSAKDCFKSKPFVCAASSAPSYPIFANCTPGWFYLASTHSCYGAQWNSSKVFANWTYANANCESLSATLPTIHNEAEFQLITSFVLYHATQFWTGIFSVDGGKIWKSVHGSYADFLDYGKWCAKNPTNATGERCVTIGADIQTEGCYRDYDCNTDYNYMMSICKKLVV